MIFVFQDQSRIPQEWLDKVAKLSEALDQLTTDEDRKRFIDKHSAVWGEIKTQLLEMSHNKCWYSEAPDAVGDWHVDHYRPKKRTLDLDKTEHSGYHWLAFDWTNYRIAGSYSNSPHKDNGGVVRGKLDYFPLMKGCAHATWADRDFSNETCLFLDPTKPGDPKLLTFDETGTPLPSDPANPIIVHRVETTVHFLYLDSPRLIAARKKKWLDTLDWIQEYLEVCPSELSACTVKDYQRMDRLVSRLAEWTGPDRPYAATARACLHKFSLGHLIKTPEEARAA